MKSRVLNRPDSGVKGVGQCCREICGVVANGVEDTSIE